MIRRILIANRGEIACRIIRTCRSMGIVAIAVYSDVDRNALHVELADEAVHLPGSTSSETYLNITSIIEAAKRTKADAIHPGYGFLSENAKFAYTVKTNNRIFIGPSPEAIEAMGDKRYSKFILKDVPFVPGYTGDDQSDQAFLKAAKEIGYPVMVKASAGGGGKGMRQVFQPDEMIEALAAARREASQAFGDDTLMLERAIQRPRHIEVQIFGDMHGNVVALGERECSIQRRHQKIIEETPSPAINAALRRKICETAVQIGSQIGYSSAGTVEFLLDSEDQFYFMEMNTRLQVEHPVTEEVYGVDLVRWQIEVADGARLKDLHPRIQADKALALGEPQRHALEVRIYAEDPANLFLPVVGHISHWHAPENVRVDAGIRSGDEISTYYDPMIAKIIAVGANRMDTLRKMDYALAQTQLFGLKSNIGFLRHVLSHPEQINGMIHTHFLDEHPELMDEPSINATDALIAAALTRTHAGFWRNNLNRPIHHTFLLGSSSHSVDLFPLRKNEFRILVNGTEHQVTLHSQVGQMLTITVDGLRRTYTVLETQASHVWVHDGEGTTMLRWLSPFPAPHQTSDSEGSLHAPMPGQVIRITVEPGQLVRKGALLMILEAMKMEHRIEAPYPGTVEQIRYQVGDKVPQDAVLLELTPDESSANSGDEL